MRSSSFSQDVSSFIAQQMAEGKFHSEEELMVEAVRVLREVKSHQRQFAEDVRLGFDQLDRGKFNQYDEAGLRGRFEELKDRVQPITTRE